MGQDKKPAAFVRDATGLVKSISLLHVTFYTLIGTLGIGPALGMVFLALFPVALWGPLPAFSWVILLVGALVWLLGISYSYLTSVMPRTGGDYVFTTRVLSPSIGFLEGWMTTVAMPTFVGFNFYFGIVLLGATLESGAVMPNGQGLVSLGSWLTTQTGLIVASIPIFLIFLYTIGFRPARSYFRLNSVISVIALVTSIPLLLLMVSSGMSDFASNFAKFAGMTTDQLVTTAATAGCCANAVDFTGFGGMLVFGLFTYITYQFSANIGSEIKGQTDNAVFISMTVAIIGAAWFFALYFIPFMYGAGYNLVNSWSFLYWSGSSSTPMRIPPLPPVLLSLANPSLAPIAIVLFIPLVLVNFILFIPLVGLAVRNLLAFSMDRVLPAWFASVNPKTGTPVKGTLFILVIGYLFFLAQVFGFNPVSTAYWATILVLPSFTFPAVDALLLKRRRPDLYEKAPKRWRKSVMGVSVVNLASIVWLIFAIPVYVLFIAYPLVTSAASSSSIVGFALSSGVLYALVIMVVGYGIFYVSKRYYASQGVDRDLIFKTIPPE